MRMDLTDLTVIVDRSGSMASCEKEAENGVNHLIKQQKKQDGDCWFSLVQFDNEYEFVHNAIPIKEAKKYRLKPRAMTALLDAVGRAITETGDRLEKLDERERPGLVVIAIVTDGYENASREFTKQQVGEMIKRQTEKYNWQFTFVGANQDAFVEASSIGIPLAAAANFAVEKADKAFVAINNNVIRMRTSCAAGEEYTCGYVQSERDEME